MTTIQLPVSPKEVTKTILKKLSNRRMQDVLEKRFGLKGGRRRTLEEIGREYQITRERVRQIEVDAMKQLRKGEEHIELVPVISVLKEYIDAYGGVMSEIQLTSSLADIHAAPHVTFLMDLANDLHYLSETDAYHPRWAIDRQKGEAVEMIVDGVVKHLKIVHRPVTEKALYEQLTAEANRVLGNVPPAHVLACFLQTSRLLEKNPYDEYGLASWSEINPRGVRDKAYLAFLKRGSPMHFREVAQEINKVGWTKKKAHPQTVHNELIKDGRFVLVGRGLYALAEWGYQPGVVRDVLVSVIKEAGRPLTRDEIIERVLGKRLVKTPTILLNLQNKSLFKKADDERYTLV